MTDTPPPTPDRGHQSPPGYPPPPPGYQPPPPGYPPPPPGYPPPPPGYPPPPPGYPPPPPGYPPPQKPIFKRWWFWAAVVGVLIIGSAINGGNADNTSTTSTATPSLPAPSAPTTVTPSPAPLPRTSVEQPPPASTVPSAGQSVDLVMPDLTGMDLQSAQDAVQAHGVFFSRSHDLLDSRRQILDRDWQVCTQNIPAGQRVTGDAELQIDFGVVKLSETCP